MILFIGGPVDWEGGVGHGRHGRGVMHWIPWERLRDSPELRVWIRKSKIIWSDDGQKDKWADRIFTCRLDSCKRGRVKTSSDKYVIFSQGCIIACPSFCLAVSCRLFPHEFFHHQTFSYQALYVIIIIIIGMIITITSLIPGACKDENEESSLRIPHLQVLVQLQY